VTEVDKKGEAKSKFNRLTMAAINPHTIQAKGRACADCHAEPKTVGLGEGKISFAPGGKLLFTGIGQGVITPAGQTPAFDAYVNIDGRPLQHSSRPGLRPFNQEELRRILRVGLCLPCHGNYQDAAWKKYDGKGQGPLKCPKTGVAAF